MTLPIEIKSHSDYEWIELRGFRSASIKTTVQIEKNILTTSIWFEFAPPNFGLALWKYYTNFFFVSITIEWSKKWVMEQSKIVKEIELKYSRDALYVDYLLWKIIDLQRIDPESPWKIIFCLVCSVHRKAFLSGFYRRPVKHWWQGRV